MLNKFPKLMILGYARHGKDTVADILAKSFGLRAMSSSLWAAEKVMKPYFDSIGVYYANFDEMYADRVNHRQEWFEQIKTYNAVDGARLARSLYENHDIYVGIRNPLELEAINAERLYDYSIWVDRSKHLEPEPTTSNQMRPDMANYVLDNNGTLQELEINARLLYLDLLSLEVYGSTKGQ